MLLVAGSLVLFVHSVRQRDFEHADRLALAPLDDDTTFARATIATARTPIDACKRNGSSTTTPSSGASSSRRCLFGIVGMLVGALVACQLALLAGELRHPVPDLRAPAPAAHQRGDLRLRRQHDLRRHLLLDAAAAARRAWRRDLLSRIHFWGWQAIIVAAAITLPLGFTQGKEYAELEWPIDIAIAVVWVVFAVNFFWTLARRNEKHLYVAIWFYIATIVTVAMLHIVNNLALPTRCAQELPDLRAACRTRWCSGGTATTPSRSS